MKTRFYGNFQFSLILVITVMSLALGACQRNKRGPNTPSAPAPAPTAPGPITGNTYLQYEFQMWNCTTGRQSFNTLAEKCQALMDDQLNNNCAEVERHLEYERSCQGEWTPRRGTLPHWESPFWSAGVYFYWDLTCNTGVHKYSNRTEYCQMLVDDRANNDCKNEFRRALHERYCDDGYQFRGNPFRYEVKSSDSDGWSCSTGRKKFRSRAKFCKALLDERFNNYCGRKERMKMYRRYCPVTNH